MVLASCGWSYTAYVDSLSELLWSCLECCSSDELAPSERACGTWLTWLERFISRFYTAVPAVLGELCTESPLLSMACEACSVCQGPGWDSKIAGQNCSEVLQVVHLLLASQSCCSLWCWGGWWRKASSDTVERDLLQSVPSVSLAACLALPVVYPLMCFRRAEQLKCWLGVRPGWPNIWFSIIKDL